MKASKYMVATLLLIFVGETLGIYAEVLGARIVFLQGAGFVSAFALAFAIIFVSGALLIAGYMLGILSLKNIWAVGVVSVCSILIMEPLLDYSIFGQLPTAGAAIGFGMAALGLVVDLLVK